jgi:transcriptional regulator with XRE-family HTH domain
VADTLHKRVVRLGCELVGTDHLADRLDVSRAVVERWLAGTATPTPRAFLRILGLLRAANPAYRLLIEP